MYCQYEFTFLYVALLPENILSVSLTSYLRRPPGAFFKYPSKPWTMLPPLCSAVSVKYVPSRLYI